MFEDIPRHVMQHLKEWLATFPRMFFTLPGTFEDIPRMFRDATFHRMFGDVPQNV